MADEEIIGVPIDRWLKECLPYPALSSEEPKNIGSLVDVPLDDSSETGLYLELVRV